MKFRSTKRQLSKPQSLRQQSYSTNTNKKSRRIKTTVSKVKAPIKTTANLLNKEIRLPVPVPDNRFGKFITKRRYIIPRFFKDAWSEIKQVVWPNKKETIKLSVAVSVFAIVFGIMIWLVDMGLDYVFKKLLIK